MVRLRYSSFRISPGDQTMPSLEAPPAVDAPLLEAIRSKLQAAPSPLKVVDVVKGLPRPKKVKAAEFQDTVRSILTEEVRLGRAFCSPSGKAGELRYWGSDEKQVLRGKALELAVTPQTLPTLKKELGKEIKGADGAFIEALVRELIGEDKLFEYPPKKTKGSPTFGVLPPPPALPPLDQDKHKKKVDKIITDCRKLLSDAGVSAEELLQILQVRLNAESTGNGPSNRPETPAPEKRDEHRPPSTEVNCPSGLGLEDLILKAVAAAPVVSLADLRREMPREYQGQAFDEAVLRLADEQRVVISQDAHPNAFSEVERAAYVQDGGAVFTTIAKWS
jgi:hypothetical protein